MATLSKQKLKCKCGKKVIEYAWDTDKIKCPSCNEIMAVDKVKPKTVVAIRTPTKNR